MPLLALPWLIALLVGVTVPALYSNSLHAAFWAVGAVAGCFMSVKLWNKRPATLMDGQFSLQDFYFHGLLFLALGLGLLSLVMTILNLIT